LVKGWVRMCVWILVEFVGDSVGEEAVRENEDTVMRVRMRTR
jgi:hypothetical protein